MSIVLSELPEEQNSSVPHPPSPSVQIPRNESTLLLGRVPRRPSVSHRLFVLLVPTIRCFLVTAVKVGRCESLQVLLVSQKRYNLRSGNVLVVQVSESPTPSLSVSVRKLRSLPNVDGIPNSVQKIFFLQVRCSGCLLWTNIYIFHRPGIDEWFTINNNKRITRHQFYTDIYGVCSRVESWTVRVPRVSLGFCILGVRDMRS